MGIWDISRLHEKDKALKGMESSARWILFTPRKFAHLPRVVLSSQTTPSVCVSLSPLHLSLSLSLSLSFSLSHSLSLQLTLGKRPSMLASDIKTPSTCTLSRKHDTCGETNSPVLKPPSWRDRAILSATEPCARVRPGQAVSTTQHEDEDRDKY